MNNQHIRHLIVLLAVLGMATVITPSRADDTTQQPAAGGSAPDDGSGASMISPPSYSHVQPRGLAAPQPEPPGLPATSKSGDDLIVGGTTYPGYLKGLPPGQSVSVSVVVPGHGGCVLQVDGNGNTMSSKCDQ